MGIVDAISSEWRNIIKENTYSEPFQLNEDRFQLPVMRSAIIMYFYGVNKLLLLSRRAERHVRPPSRPSFYIYMRYRKTVNKLFAFKIVDSPVCTFCENEDDSLEHLF